MDDKSDVLNFEEFRAVTRRQNASTKNTKSNVSFGNKSDSKESKKVSKGKPTTWSVIVNNIASATAFVGSLVEQNGVQVLYVILLFLDTFCAMMTLIIHYALLHQSSQPSPSMTAGMETTDPDGSGSLFTRLSAFFLSVMVVEGGYTHPALSLLLPALKSISTLALFVFILEIMVVLVAFRLRILTHAGYLVDFVVLCVQLYEELGVIPGLVAAQPATGGWTVGILVVGGGASWRVLNLFRCWRLIRLYTSLVAIEIGKHEVTRNSLELKVKELKVAEIAKFKLENDLRKEKESLVAVETMLVNYKEEVSTLNEALKIAALDIAEIAQTDEDEESNAVLNETLNTLQQTLSAQQAKEDMDAQGKSRPIVGSGSSNAEQVHQHVKRDSAPSAAAAAGGTSFIVNQDGSFVKS